MQAFEIGEIAEKREQTGRAYLEFLREKSLSAGLYTLAAGAVDSQQPHTEDEVYYVVSGKGAILVGEENREVKTGSLIFVPAGQIHRFYNISEELNLLVFFAPAEYSQR